MRLYAIQPDILWESPQPTIAHIRRLLAKVTIEPGSLVVLPEMFSTGFSMNVANIAEGDARLGESFLRELAMTHQCEVVGGVVRQALDGSGKGLNQAVAFDAQGSELVRYNKIHPFSYAQETDHYQAGRQVKVFSHQGWTIAPVVCYDLRFPELFRISAGMGAHMQVVIANWPASRIEHWTTLLRARAIENQTYVIGVNRTGLGPTTTYNGQTAIFNPKGQLLAQADDMPGVIHAQADFSELEAYRAKFPALRDMKYHWSAEALGGEDEGTPRQDKA